MATETPVLFFDGVCNLCNATISWLMSMDKHEKPDGIRLKFASLQSEPARRSLKEKGLQPESFINTEDAKDETVVFVADSGKVSRCRPVRVW